MCSKTFITIVDAPLALNAFLRTSLRYLKTGSRKILFIPSAPAKRVLSCVEIVGSLV